MKKIILFLMSAMLMVSLAACTPTQPKMETTPPDPQVMASTGGASDKVPDPNAEPMEIISVYSMNDDKTGLNQAMDAVDKLTAEALVSKLIEYGVLEEGTTVLKYESADGVGTLDLSAVPKSDDKLIITSIGNTFVENFELSKLKLLVNGKNYSNSSIKLGDNDYLEYEKDYKEIK
ncbi:GerMN domain-containing protein [Clostridium boliviensis]|uniref:GerMN domain-containing protein n=1 Tax=Clostridium boliviensis TaxID=318465 RepID=A0ABU4GH96_9CLOT|nr:GerMN domain-containing protein [Clostridium boliviensis]MDW2796999.1 GerMN domain-containing protein [Clostridium boliviensis]